MRPHDTAHFICKQREEKARGRREGGRRPAQVMASQSGISQATVLHYSVRLRVGSRGLEERESEKRHLDKMALVHPSLGLMNSMGSTPSYSAVG